MDLGELQGMEDVTPARRSEAGFFCPAFVGLRCMLLLAVLEGHYWFEATGDPRFHPLTFAVPCFFVLSGYLISHTLFRYEGQPWIEAAKTFYLRRAFRILPPFYLTLVAVHLLYGLPYVAWQASYLMNVKIFLLSAFHPREFVGYAYLRDRSAMHFWSIDVEEQFYLLFPLLVRLTHKHGRTLTFCTLIGGSFALRSYLYVHWHHSYYGGLGPVAGEYILWGCLFAWLDFQGRFTFLRRTEALYLSMALFALLATLDRSYGATTQWKPPPHATLYALLLSVFVLSLRYSPESIPAKFLSLKWLAPIGTVSYGAYLLHPFMNPLTDLVVRAFPPLAIFPACPRAVAGPVLTIAAAALMWWSVEKPIDRFRRNFRPLESRS